MQNPFEFLDHRLSVIESYLVKLDEKFYPPQQADQWFDLNELCSYLPDKPATATVYAWVHTAQIPCHKGGKKLRFLKSEIDNWLMQGRKKTFAETASEADAYLAAKRKGGVNHG
jgi:predicted DNA-binding transcriptional regulator AlpA